MIFAVCVSRIKSELSHSNVMEFHKLYAGSVHAKIRICTYKVLNSAYLGQKGLRFTVELRECCVYHLQCTTQNCDK